MTVSPQLSIEGETEGLRVVPIGYREAEALIVEGHYIGHLRKSGFQVGLYDRELVGVAVFGQPSREGVARAFGGDLKSVIELLRFYTTDAYGELGTWFLSRAVKLLPRQYEIVVAYSDPEAGHYGGLYQAASWIYLGRTSGTPYWYEDADGQRIGKQTPWKAAKRERDAGRAPASETPAEGERRIASERGWVRVDGETKYRYAYPRSRKARRLLTAFARPYPKPDAFLVERFRRRER